MATEAFESASYVCEPTNLPQNILFIARALVKRIGDDSPHKILSGVPLMVPLDKAFGILLPLARKVTRRTGSGWDSHSFHLNIPKTCHRARLPGNFMTR